MADETPKIIVDDDWKAQARKEKEQLTEATESHPQEQAPPASFSELINSLALQVVMSLGLMTMPNGERIPPNLESAKFLIDTLDVLDQKTKGNLTPEEKHFLDQTLYDLRMAYVQITTAMSGVAPGAAAGPGPSGALPGKDPGGKPRGGLVM